MKKIKKKLKAILFLIILGLAVLIATGCSDYENILNGNILNTINDVINTANSINDTEENTVNHTADNTNTQILSYDLNNIPEYNGEIYVILNNNIPDFNQEHFTTKCFESYSELDELKRCGVAFANLGKETMPKDGEERQSISEVKPSGWMNKKYSSEIVEGEYIYNRSHLIAYMLSAENANEKNLITGTRYFNAEGMLPFETLVMEYLKGNPTKHVLYRVTPMYEGDNLVATGVQMEAQSVEDNGKGICFNIFVYNVQPGITIDYKTGYSELTE